MKDFVIHDNIPKRLITRTMVSLSGRVMMWIMVALLATCTVWGAARMQPMERHYQAACSAITKGDKDRAKLELKLSLQNNPLHAKSHFLLACLLGEKGEIDQSIVGFQRALTLEPDDPDSLYNLGTMLLWRGETVPAARLLEQAVSIRSKHVPGYNNLAKAYFLSGLPEMAVSTYREALRLDPANAIALKNLADLNKTAGNHDVVIAQRQGFVVPKTVEGIKSPVKETKSKTVSASPPPIQKAVVGEQTQSAVPGEMVDLDALAAELQEILRELPNVTVERRGGRIAIAGWTSDPKQRQMLNRILAGWPDVLDLTTDDLGDSKRMLEVDAIIFYVFKLDAKSAGFNFLRLIQMNSSYFATDHQRDGTGFAAPDTIGPVSHLPQQGWIFSASVDYDVNIANASNTEVALLARPHLTTLSGTPAKFLAGGELVYRVAGNISGDIKLYPYGTTLTVTPTLLRSPGEEGAPRIHLAVDAGRTSILSLLTASSTQERDNFSKISVNSEAILGLGQTLILSGLNQRETNTDHSGVPILRSIPIVKYFFSTKTITDSQLSVIILLTPRDPAFIGEQTRQAISEFVEMRRAYVSAMQGTEEDMRSFKERYPDWNQIPPNYFASHNFLIKNSELYRSFNGQDLSSEDLEFGLLGPRLKKKNPQSNGE